MLYSFKAYKGMVIDLIENMNKSEPLLLRGLLKRNEIL